MKIEVTDEELRSIARRMVIFLWEMPDIADMERAMTTIRQLFPELYWYKNFAAHVVMEWERLSGGISSEEQAKELEELERQTSTPFKYDAI